MAQVINLNRSACVRYGCFDLEVSRTKGSALRFLMKGDKLTVDVAS